jgi:hypothetical protein
VQWAQRDRRQTERAVAGGDGGLWRRRAEPRRLPDDDEHGEGDDDEVDDRVDEHTVVQRGRAGRLGRRQAGIALPPQGHEEVREVHALEGEADGRHENVVHEGGDDAAEGGAEDEGDGEIDDVAPGEERFEVLDHVAS